MEDAGVVKLYEPSPTQCLYVAPAGNMVGRIPLMPCYLDGNKTPTIQYSKNKIHVSLLVVQTQQQRMAGVATTPMRSTRGCGSLDVASLAWAA